MAGTLVAVGVGCTGVAVGGTLVAVGVAGTDVAVAGRLTGVGVEETARGVVTALVGFNAGAEGAAPQALTSPITTNTIMICANPAKVFIGPLAPFEKCAA